ncbi:MAG: GGDEF domain-containing protein [Pseudomonadota bacterium]
MAQTPNVIGITVMQRLRETGQPPTPENYARVYYEISGLPPPPVSASPPPQEPQIVAAQDNSICAELIQALREMVQDVSDKTGTLAKTLGDKNKDLTDNVNTLKNSRDKQEILRLLSTVVMQASGIQNTVEASHKELQETRYTIINMQNELAETRQLLNEDALTGALNRRGLDQTLGREIARCHRNNAKLALAMVDLDFFKNVNDTYGHEAGDQMLIHFASLIRSVMRKSDALVRYGGEEFTLVLPDTDSRGALLVLGRLQQLMKKSPLLYEGKQVNTTFSAGLAALGPDENGHALLRRADEALYQAKNSGRDKIVTAD